MVVALMVTCFVSLGPWFKGLICNQNTEPWYLEGKVLIAYYYSSSYYRNTFMGPEIRRWVAPPPPVPCTSDPILARFLEGWTTTVYLKRRTRASVWMLQTLFDIQRQSTLARSQFCIHSKCCLCERGSWWLRCSFIYLILFLAALGLHCCAQAFFSWGEWGLLFVAVWGYLIAVASLMEHRL